MTLVHQFDSKTPMPDIITNSLVAERSHLKQPEYFSSLGMVNGANLPSCPMHLDFRSVNLDITIMQIKETTKENTKKTTTVNIDEAR